MTLRYDLYILDHMFSDWESKSIKQICKISIHPPSLITIHFAFQLEAPWSLDLALQLELVQDVATAFPTLLQVRLSDEVEWHRVRHQHDIWRPTIVRGHRSLLRTSLENRLRMQHSETVKDYDRCFAGLFDPTSVIDQTYLRKLDYAVADDQP